MMVHEGIAHCKMSLTINMYKVKWGNLEWKLDFWYLLLKEVSLEVQNNYL